MKYLTLYLLSIMILSCSGSGGQRPFNSSDPKKPQVEPINADILTDSKWCVETGLEQIIVYQFADEDVLTVGLKDSIEFEKGTWSLENNILNMNYGISKISSTLKILDKEKFYLESEDDQNEDKVIFEKCP